MGMTLFLSIAASVLLSAQQTLAVQQFHVIAPKEVPASLFNADSLLCEGLEPEHCWPDFLASGAAWRGDLNDDGDLELLIRATVLGGSGGDAYFLFGSRQQRWIPIASSSDGWLTLTGLPRFDILPVVRNGYHDIRISAIECFKWNGKHYLPYEPADYRQLNPSWFDASRIDEAELFWSIRYQGEKRFVFEPQWFNAAPGWGSNVELDDPKSGMQWHATFKGGVYGIKHGRSFLLLPRPAYRGAEKLEMQDEWLVIYATAVTLRDIDKAELRPFARFNIRSRELLIEQELH